MRPEAQLYVHVLSATVLFGAIGTVAVLGLAARRRTDQRPLARAALLTLLVLAVPAWVLTFVFGSWTKSKAHWPDGLAWIDIGFRVSDFGLIILLVSAGIAYRWTRRPDSGWPAPTIAALACVYLAGLAVAWWVMTAKVPT